MSFVFLKKGCSISKNGIKIFFEMLNSNKILKKVFIKGKWKEIFVIFIKFYFGFFFKKNKKDSYLEESIYSLIELFSFNNTLIQFKYYGKRFLFFHFIFIF